MRGLLRLTLLGAAFALATRALGWWAVPVLGAAWTLVSRGAIRAPWEAALCAIIGWSSIFVWTAATGPLGELTRRTAEIFTVPSAALVGVTLLYGGLLAWGGAGVALIFTARRSPPPESA